MTHIAAKLLKKDQDIVHAYNIIDSTIENVKELRKYIKDEFYDWFMDANCRKKMPSNHGVTYCDTVQPLTLRPIGNNER